MFSRFFIDRPIFATVLSVVITLAGGVCLFTLPLAQFPRVSPPMVSVTCNYPGASAEDVSEAVAAPIEQQVNGVEGMMYMSSACTNDGSYSLSVTFRPGVDLDMAQVMVQNRVALALPSLPDVIKQTGVTVRKRSPDPIIGFAIVSPNDRFDQLHLSNYTVRKIRDELLRVPGVSDINILGQRDYSLRIWVNPNRLAARGMTASELVRAIQEQNSQVAAGMIGQPPSPGQDLQITLSTLGRLETVEQFENIIIKNTPDGRIVKLKDIARVELGARNQDITCRFDGMETAFMIVFQSPDANALDTRDRVKARMDELAAVFPDGMTYEISFDTTPYTRESIGEVFKTLRDSTLLVAAVVLLFLQNWRSALIPLLAVPVGIIGTFSVMAAFGFSINTLTLFGLVLAIGIVVDDAIVVVEAVEHHMEAGLAPRAAAYKAMEQVSGPVIAVGLVLSAVFVPCAFISGITGAFFRQFALTIAVSTLISAFNSLTLSPALAVVLLRPRTHGKAATPLPRLAFPLVAAWLAHLFLSNHVQTGLDWLAQRLPTDVAASLADASGWLAPTLAGVAGGLVGWLLARPLNIAIGWSFGMFNRGFQATTTAYARSVGMVLRVSLIAIVVYVGALAGTYHIFTQTPKGFIPSQDLGYLLVSVQLPDAASKERTDEVVWKLQEIALATPGITHATTTSGQSFALNAFGPNFGSMFVRMAEYENRRSPSLSSEAIAVKLRAAFAAEVPEAIVNVFAPPPVRGAGRAGGFAIAIEDRGDLGSAALQEEVQKLVQKGNETSGLVGVNSVFRAKVPQLKIEADLRQCLLRGVAVKDFSDTLRIFQGSAYVNDFNLFGRTWQVIVQADHSFRDEPEDLNRLKVRSRRNTMVPLGSVARIKEINGPLVLTRYNMYPAAMINGNAQPGVSSRDAIERMQQIAETELPRSMRYEWTDMSYLELIAGNTAYLLFALAVVMVFLVLAAQYESWSMPFAVILVVPMCLCSAILGVHLAKMEINIFTQVGFVVLVGLASKNAVLIVEFAKKLRAQGVERRQATLDACRMRLRPIIMTSLAFILGVLPLLWASGAGSEMRKALGTAVFSGMVGVTVFGVFLTPVFFWWIDRLGETRAFSTGVLRRVGDTMLDLLTLGPARRTAVRLWPRRNGVSANGNGQIQRTEDRTPTSKGE